LARQTADQLAKKQRNISISEFFEKNKHILGFSTTTRALLTTVKEGVDNALDACEDAQILPDIFVKINEVEGEKDEYAITISDNGPGIVRKQIPKVYGKLLYGSRFHAMKQTRGQQGIGISAAVLYGQLTTGQPTIIESKTGEDMPAYRIKLTIDSATNSPRVMNKEVILMERPHGTMFTIILKGKYVKNKKQSILQYMSSTAIVNPHARFTFIEPDGTNNYFDRVTDELPLETREIKPHPKGVEIGSFMKMAKKTSSYKLTSFLVNDFSRISYTTARKICKEAGVEESSRPTYLSLEKIKKLLDAIDKTSIMAPPTDCLSPIGPELMKKGLSKEIDAKFVFTVSRPPSVFSGTPFQVEAGLVYGGDIPVDSRIGILRFANRVPLLYQSGNCIITKAIENIDWRPYHLEQRGGKGKPIGPAVVLVHVASVNIPFTSEAKVAISNVDEMSKEIELAVRECARQMRSNIKRNKKLKKTEKKFDLIQEVLPEIARKSAEIIEKPMPPIGKVISKIMTVITVEDNIEHLKDTTSSMGKWVSRSHISVNNYTTANKSIDILVKIPKGQVTNVEPAPVKNDGDVLVWEISDLPPAGSTHLKFELSGLDKGDHKQNEILYMGTRSYVIGAKKLHI